MLRLDPEKHIYYWDERRVDGLTSTIDEAGLISTYASEWYKLRGTALHLATEFNDRGTLDENSVDPEIHGYLESWRKFRIEQNYTPDPQVGIEHKFYNSVLMLGMKIDRLPGPLDLKTGAPEEWHILQVAVQWATLIGDGLSHLALSPRDVYLDHDGGPPSVKNYTQVEMREAYRVYASMLHFLRWKREKGLK
jgi:hypothetical protein